jgi:hypothetical protein
MVRTKYGASLHKMLVEEAEELLKGRGYEVARNVSVGPGPDGRLLTADVAGRRDDPIKERVAVECMIEAFPSIATRRVKSLETFFDKVIVLAPSGSRQLVLPPPHEFLYSQKVSSVREVKVSVSEETYKELVRARAAYELQLGETLSIDDVLKIMLEYMPRVEVVIKSSTRPRARARPTKARLRRGRGGNACPLPAPASSSSSAPSERSRRLSGSTGAPQGGAS